VCHGEWRVARARAWHHSRPGWVLPGCVYERTAGAAPGWGAVPGASRRDDYLHPQPFSCRSGRRVSFLGIAWESATAGTAVGMADDRLHQGQHALLAEDRGRRVGAPRWEGPGLGGPGNRGTKRGRFLACPEPPTMP